MLKNVWKLNSSKYTLICFNLPTFEPILSHLRSIKIFLVKIEGSKTTIYLLKVNHRISRGSGTWLFDFWFDWSYFPKLMRLMIIKSITLTIDFAFFSLRIFVTLICTQSWKHWFSALAFLIDWRFCGNTTTILKVSHRNSDLERLWFRTILNHLLRETCQSFVNDFHK